MQQIGELTVARSFLLAALLAAVTAGCSTGYRTQNPPLVDMRGHTYKQYHNDLYDCETIAAQKPGAGQSAAVGAGVGAVTGALLGSKGHKNEMTALGAAVGAIGGLAYSSATRDTAVKRCLAGRGYSVLE